jgi:hypothetical protein
MEDEPRRLLRDANFLGELHRRNALARRHKQIHRVNPLVQRNVRALKNRSGPNREILLALIATIETALADRDTIAKPANGASRPIRPKASFKINPRRLLVWEHLEKLESGNCALGHRATSWPRTKNRIKLAGSQVYNSLNLLSFTSVYFFESGLFNGLQPIQIKNFFPLWRLALQVAHPLPRPSAGGDIRSRIALRPAENP